MEVLLERDEQLAEACLTASVDLEESVSTDAQRDNDEQGNNAVYHAVKRVGRTHFLIKLLNDFSILRSVLNILKSLLILHEPAACAGIEDKQYAIGYCRAYKTDNNERQKIFPESAFHGSLSIGL